MTAPLDIMKSWVETITGLIVIYDGDPEPSAPRPNVESRQPTYAAIQFTTDESPFSTAYEELTDTPGVDPTKYVEERSLVRRGELDIAIYGPGAADYCRSLELSIGSQQTMTILDAAGDYAITVPTAVSDDPILRSATREPSAAIQFTIEWVETSTAEIEPVETIETTVDVTEES